MKQILKSSQGKNYRLDRIIRPGISQIRPGFVQLNLTPCDSDKYDSTSDHIGVQLPEYLSRQWIAGYIRVKV
jgi:hypothetical protein